MRLSTVLAHRRMGARTLLEIDKIKKLIEMMVANDLVEISLRDGEEEVNLRRPNAQLGGMPSFTPMVVDAGNPNGGVPSAAPAPPPAAAPDSQPEEAEEGLVEVESPMVGTFYEASDPDSAPFVTIGQQVQVGSVLCVLEAMKVFNDVKSDAAGIVRRVLLENGKAVKAGQDIFVLEAK